MQPVIEMHVPARSAAAAVVVVVVNSLLFCMCAHMCGADCIVATTGPIAINAGCIELFG